jgi:hypothetical protein
MIANKIAGEKKNKIIQLLILCPIFIYIFHVVVFWLQPVAPGRTKHEEGKATLKAIESPTNWPQPRHRRSLRTPPAPMNLPRNG